MANTFIELNDTPSSYTGNVQYLITAGNQIDFVTLSTNELIDVNTLGAYKPVNGQVLQWFGGANEFRPAYNDPYSPGNGLNKSGLTLNVVAGTGGGLVSNTSGIFLETVAGVAGVYGNATHVPVFTVNDRGQVTDASFVEGSFQVAQTLAANHIRNIAGTSGQIRVTNGTGVAANAVVDLVATGVTAAVYGNTTHLPQITVDTYGRIQNVDLVAVSTGNLMLGNGNISISDITTEAYRNIVVAGQTTLSADAPHDTLTMVAGAGITITTTASSDTLTISATGEVAANLALNTISDLSDVDAANATNGQALVWNSANSIFVPGSVAADLGTNSVGDLGDVSLAGVTTGQTLIWNGSSFVPGNNTINSIDDLTDVDITGVIDGQILRWSGANAKFEVSSVSTGGSGDITAVFAGDGLTGGSVSGDATLAVGAGTGITVSADAVSLSNTTVTPGTYGDSANVAQFTVDQQGRITSVTEVAIAGGGGSGTAGGERFRINYAADGSLSGTQDLTSGITSVTVDSPTGGEVTITFNSSTYNFPPTGILLYGYDYTNNKYVITPFDTTMTLREVAAGGTSGSPTLFDGAGTVTIRLRLRESETGASRGTFGTTSHAYVQFVMNG